MQDIFSSCIKLCLSKDNTNRRVLITDLLIHSPLVSHYLLENRLSIQENVAIFLWCAQDKNFTIGCKEHFYDYLLEISKGLPEELIHIR